MASDGQAAASPSPDVRARVVVFTMAGILLTLASIAFGLQLVFPDRVGVTSVARQSFPGPGVGPDERAARLALESTQRAALEGGGGRMPIAAAMRAIAAKGKRAFDPIDAPP